MSFRTKNLMLTVLPEGQEEQLVPAALSIPFCCLYPTQCIAPTVQTCYMPSHHCISPTPFTCLTPSPQCFTPTPLTCYSPSPHCFTPTPQTCFTPTPRTCFTLTPRTCFGPTLPDDTTFTTTIFEQTIEFGSVETLPLLQKQLAQLQEAAQKQLDTLQAQQKPQTVEEAEMLEKHLNEALNEVKATKESLRRKSSK